MPIYEYRCESCGVELEKLQKISDPPLLECPECGKDALKKLVSASSFRLKGSGWYETDFKTGKKKNGAADAPSEGAGSGDSSAASAATDTSVNAAGDAGKTTKATATESKPETKESKKETVKSSDGSGTGTKNKPAPTAK